MLCFQLPPLSSTFWSHAGARQANRVRGLYLQSYLRQDIAFFDTESGAGRVLQGLTEDSAAFQNAMGDKLSNFIHSITMFAAGAQAAVCMAARLRVSVGFRCSGTAAHGQEGGLGGLGTSCG